MAALRSLLFAQGLALAAPLAAQCRLCEHVQLEGGAAVQKDDLDMQVETNLSFDRMILGNAGTGAATIRPDGSSGVEGSVMELGPRATVGTVLVHGEPNRTVRIDLPRRIELFSVGGGRMTLDDVSTDVSRLARLDAAGNLSFRFGGRLILSGNGDGPYRGDLPITVEYQ